MFIFCGTHKIGSFLGAALQMLHTKQFHKIAAKNAKAQRFAIAY
jgi:hypothetical protein